MTTSAPTYTATIPGAPGVEVSVRDDTGDITFDSARWPHVQASVTIAMDDPGILDDLDPRTNKRLLLTVDDIAGTVGSRTFDFAILEGDPNRSDATVDLTLASDEAILGDHAQLVDDPNPRTYQASLRAVVNYVLSKIGAALQPGGADADVTAYWPITNLFTNPSFENTVAGWANGSLATGLAATTGQKWVGAYSGHWQTTGAGQSFIDFTGPISVQAGKSYVFTAYMRATAARPARLMTRFKNAAGVLLSDRYSAVFNLTTNGWTRLVNIQTAPAGATQATAHVEYQASGAGQFPYADGLMFYEGTEVVPYYDGDTPDDAHYTYDWTGNAGASTSTRTPVIERRPEALVWPAGVSGIEFLTPLVQAAGFRLVADERRRWTLRDESYRTAGALTYREGVNIIDPKESVSRTADTWFDGMVIVYKWRDRDGVEHTRTDAFALTGSPVKVLRREIEAPYPGPGRAEYAVRRAQGKGRTVTVSSQATWSESAEQPLTVTLTGTPIQTGLADRVRFDIGRNEVTVTSRTADTPAGAIDLLPGTINALTGTINNL